MFKKKLSLLFLIAILFVNHYLSAQVLNYTTHIKIEKGKKIIEKRILLQINNKDENWMSRISIDHAPNNKFKLLEANIYDINGEKVRKLKKKDIITKSDRSSGIFHQDDLVEEFNLYWNTYPYQIEYAYNITQEDFFNIIHWSPVLYRSIETQKALCRLKLH